jgi:hypothetical protein
MVPWGAAVVIDRRSNPLALALCEFFEAAHCLGIDLAVRQRVVLTNLAPDRLVDLADDDLVLFGDRRALMLQLCRRRDVLSHDLVGDQSDLRHGIHRVKRSDVVVNFGCLRAHRGVPSLQYF